VSSARRALAALLAAAVLALPGCAFGPDPEDLHDEARAAFENVVGVLEEVDPAVLRTVEVAAESEQACGEEDGTQRALVATGTLSITADPRAIDDTLADVADVLDPEEWDRIRRAPDAGEQSAWASADGVVVTLTFDDPVLVAAVFTPCLR
jgi:hypothetical protein